MQSLVLVLAGLIHLLYEAAGGSVSALPCHFDHCRARVHARVLAHPCNHIQKKPYTYFERGDHSALLYFIFTSFPYHVPWQMMVCDNGSLNFIKSSLSQDLKYYVPLKFE